ncbi:MAG: spore cortex-lytic enzyme [Clostridia bacterium]|nr:spore cortex-lytic enzyme [Clostridia bacterium]
MNRVNIRIKKSTLKKLWQIMVIILLTLLMTQIIEYTASVYNIINNNNSSDYTAEYVLSQLGSRGDEVRRIQRKLKQLGYYTGSVDGIYGNNTKNAVIAFQRNCGLTADGIAGPRTLLYLGLSSSSTGYSSNDKYLLAKVIEGEARGESYVGQVAVGAVILNRVDHSSFPDSISGVVYQSGAFDCVYDSNWSVEPSATAKKAAEDALNGWDPTGGAIYYYNPSKTANQWIRSRTVVTVIGRHYFAI